jgi:DnaJ domain
MPECDAAGEYRAPKARDRLNDYHWFCLEHVRAYNAGWDFYKGMSAAQIEAQLRADTAWQRPTWPLGRLGSQWNEEDYLRDPLGMLNDGKPRRPPPEGAPAELREPLATLGLVWPVTLDEAKSRWRELAKIHHPDANGGDRDAEERLKIINLAYAALRTKLATAVHQAAG